MLLSSTIIFAVTIALLEGIPLIKKKSWKELTTLVILLLIAIILVIEKLLEIPTPISIINNLLYPFGKAIFRSR